MNNITKIAELMVELVQSQLDEDVVVSCDYLQPPGG